MIKKVFPLVGCLMIGLSLNAQVNTNKQEKLDPDSFNIVLFGDPQNYVKYDYNQPVFELMTAWTADHVERLNVKAVLCTGDLVDQNECLVPPFPRFGNLTSRQQWEFASHAFGRLDNVVPYLIATGNHDYGYTRSEAPITHFPEYFNIERNNKWRKTIVSVTNNRLGVPTLENAAMEVIGENWDPILVIALEFAPRDEALEWAKELAASERFKDHIVIVVTHSYLTGFDSKRVQKEGYKMEPKNAGEAIWEKLIKPSENIRFVISGHYAVPNEKNEYTVGYSTDTNTAGKLVHQMMFNCQALGGGMSGNGGDGWLRLLEFMPDGKTIQVRTYSPLFGYSPSTKHLAWRTDPIDEFKMIIEK